MTKRTTSKNDGSSIRPKTNKGSDWEIIKPRKPARKNISYYKNILSPLHQLVARIRDTDDQGNGYCITCNKPLHFSLWDGGHCIDRKYNGTLYDPRNCHLQCKWCNGKLNKGEQYLHGTYINNRYGEGTFDELKAISKDPPKLRQRDLCQLIIERTVELEIHINRIKKNRVPDRVRKQLEQYKKISIKLKEQLDLLSEYNSL